MRRELRGVEADAGAVGLGDGSDLRDREDLAGDVGRAGDDDEPRSLGCITQGVATLVTASLWLAGAARRTVRSAGQGRSAAWCSDSNTITVASAGTAWASRLSASVVCRVKITWSSLRAPTKACTSARARSYHWVVMRDAYPLPRCTDAYDGSAASTLARTDSRQGALAPWSKLA